MSIEVKNITKSFGNFKAIDDISLKVETGELVALLGPSGSGKTTLLRIIAGLETADAGEIFFSGEDAREKKAKDRHVGFVFQHYALFRHMTVYDNIAFGLRVKPKNLRPSEEQIRRRVRELLKLIQLEWVEKRYPWQLSGGQRQRVALARALAVEPKVLLLDEPFGSLDAQVRKELRLWLRRFHDDLHITSLFVTHDQEEALEVSDRIVVMNAGKIEQVGTPDQVYHNPVNSFVLNFLGNVNLFHLRVEDGKIYMGNKEIQLPGVDGQKNVKAAKLYIRPHQFEIKRSPTESASIKAMVKFMNPAGAMVKLDLKTETDDVIQVEISQEEFTLLQLQKNDVVYVNPKEFTFYDFDI